MITYRLWTFHISEIIAVDLDFKCGSTVLLLTGGEDQDKGQASQGVGEWGPTPTGICTLSILPWGQVEN